jgi:HSP20 family protein
MNTLLYWNPFKEMEELQNRFASALNLVPARQGDLPQLTPRIAQWAPLVDISEDEKEYLITAELPEVKKDAIKVTVDNGILTLAGERKFEKEENGKEYRRIERAYGSFLRRFNIPDDADSARVNAEFKDGVLKVRLAKSEKAKPHRIEVKTE